MMKEKLFGEACENTNRKYILMEKKYNNIINKLNK